MLQELGIRLRDPAVDWSEPDFARASPLQAFILNARHLLGLHPGEIASRDSTKALYAHKRYFNYIRVRSFVLGGAPFCSHPEHNCELCECRRKLRPGDGRSEEH